VKKGVKKGRYFDDHPPHGGEEEERNRGRIESLISRRLAEEESKGELASVRLAPRKVRVSSHREREGKRIVEW